MDPVENMVEPLSNDDESDSDDEFLALKHQFRNTQSLIDECNRKIYNKTLSQEDLTTTVRELRRMTECEFKMTPRKMKSYYVPYRALASKMIQDWYLTCDWLMQKQCGEIDNIFGVCCNKEKPLFKDVSKNTDGNIKLDEGTTKPAVLTRSKRQQQKSQKRQLDNHIISVEITVDGLNCK